MNLINYILVAATLCYGSHGVLAVPIGLGRTSQLAARQVNSLDIRAEIDSELALEVRAHDSDVGAALEPQGGDTATTGGAEAPTKGQEASRSSTKGGVASKAPASGRGATGYSKVSAHGQGGNGGNGGNPPRRFRSPPPPGRLEEHTPGRFDYRAIASPRPHS